MALTEADEKLLERIRKVVAGREGFAEKKMFGGKAFFLNGNMCLGTWKGALIVRLDKANHDVIQAEEHTAPMDITGKVMKGWAIVNTKGIATPRQLKAWIDRAARYVGTLPAKT